MVSKEGLKEQFDELGVDPSLEVLDKCELKREENKVPKSVLFSICRFGNLCQLWTK